LEGKMLWNFAGAVDSIPLDWDMHPNKRCFIYHPNPEPYLESKNEPVAGSMMPWGVS